MLHIHVFLLAQVDVGPTLETINMVFSAFGEVAKIMMFDKPGGLQALVQFSDPRVAREAQASLDGRSIPTYLVPNHPTPIAMQVSFSQHTDLHVTTNSSRSRCAWLGGWLEWV